MAVLAVAVDQVDAEVDLPPEGADGDGVAVRRLVEVRLQALVALLADLAVSRHGLRRGRHRTGRRGRLLLDRGLLRGRRLGRRRLGPLALVAVTPPVAVLRKRRSLRNRRLRDDVGRVGRVEGRHARARVLRVEAGKLLELVEDRAELEVGLLELDVGRAELRGHVQPRVAAPRPPESRVLLTAGGALEADLLLDIAHVGDDLLELPDLDAPLGRVLDHVRRPLRLRAGPLQYRVHASFLESKTKLSSKRY